MRTGFDGGNMRDVEQENDPYLRYQKRGGIINREDYENALRRSTEIAAVSGITMKQAKHIATFAGIELQNAENRDDPRIKLYAILRSDEKPEEIKWHHAQMSDQRLFAEVLRILGSTDALNKLIDAYHKVRTHCPICLKVVTSGEECS